MIDGIVEHWRRFWALPRRWKVAVFTAIPLAVLVIALLIGVAADGGDGSQNVARASPIVVASRSPNPSAVASPSSPALEATPTPTPGPGDAVPPPEPLPATDAPPLPTLVPPAPSPLPPQTGLSPEQQAIVDQFGYCSDTWWKAATIQIQLAIASQSGGSRTQLEEQLKTYMDYLQQNCVGIGARAAAIPGVPDAWCTNIKNMTTTVTVWARLAQLLRFDTSALDFAQKELEGFTETAGC